MNDFKYDIGDCVIVNVPEHNSHNRDSKTGLYIPDFFYLLNGREFEIFDRKMGPEFDPMSGFHENWIYPRYGFNGRFEVQSGNSVDLQNYWFDEHWLTPASDDLIVESEVDFY